MERVHDPSRSSPDQLPQHVLRPSTNNGGESSFQPQAVLQPRRPESICSYMSATSALDDDDPEVPTFMAAFDPDVDEDAVQTLASIPFLAFLDAHRQPAAIVRLPESSQIYRRRNSDASVSSYTSSSTASSTYEQPPETIWGNLSFFSVTRGRQLVDCLEKGEAKALSRWMYGAPPEKTVDDPIGHLEEIDLSLSPTLTVTLYADTSSPTTLELCKTISPSSPHLILTSHIISNRATINPLAGGRGYGSSPSSSSSLSASATNNSPSKLSPIANLALDHASHISSPLSTSQDSAPPSKSTVEINALPSKPASSANSSPNSSKPRPSKPIPIPDRRRPPPPTQPEAIPARKPLRPADPSAPDLPERHERQDPERDAMRRDFERVFDGRMQEITLLCEWSPVGMFSGTPDGLLTYVNKQFRVLTGLASPNDWPSIFIPSHRLPLRQMWEDCFRSGKPGSGEFKLLSGVGSPASYVRIDLVGLTSNQANNSDNPFVSGFCGTMVDVSERHEYTKSLKVMAEERINAWKQRVEDVEAHKLELIEAKAQQELLIDITSHEIRNPTSAISQAAELLRSNIKDFLQQYDVGETVSFSQEDRTRMRDDILILESIQHSASIQERLSNDILRLAQLNLGLLSLHATPFDLREETRRLIRIFQVEAESKGIELRLELGESFRTLNGTHVECDPVRLAQIVTNLLTNAVKFSQNAAKRLIILRANLSLEPPSEDGDGDCCMPPPTERSTNLPVDGSLIEGWLYYEVQDFGGGMSPSDQEHLFERFAQGNAKVHTTVGGSGLGLFICRELCTLQNGKIDVTSSQTEGSSGTTFRFYIAAKFRPASSSPATDSISTTAAIDSSPLRRTVSPPAPALNDQHRPRMASIFSTSSIDEQPGTPTSPTPDRSGKEGDRLSILVAEDNEINVKLLLRQFAKLSYEIEIADDGQYAIDALMSAAARGHTYDCVLMDMEMPRKNGIEATKEIRQLEADGLLPGRQLILSVSGNARKGQIDLALQAGVDDTLTKPYAFKTLLARILDLLAARRPAQETSVSAVASTTGSVSAWTPTAPELGLTSSFLNWPTSPSDVPGGGTSTNGSDMILESPFASSCGSISSLLSPHIHPTDESGASDVSRTSPS